MANATATPPAETPKPTFSTKPLTELPKREAPTREFDKETANTLLAIVSVEGQTATDGTIYADEKAARSKASSYRRLLTHVVDTTKHDVKTKVYGEGDGFAWAVYLAPATPKKPRKRKAS